MNSSQPVFPCTTIPDASTSKLLGLYPQRQDGLWMQRIKLQGGALTSQQWTSLAALCRKHTPDAPLHITTRQDIEFHNLRAETIPRLQADLSIAGFTGLGACGDTLRNITLCPGNGLCDGSVDFSAAAHVVRQTLESYSNIYALPRKFKISFSACSKACAQPWINDLGFVATACNGTASIRLIGAGSLGPRPATGIIIKERLAPDEIAAGALAGVQMFDTHGDRTNRRKARLRHVRERLGDGLFIDEFNRECAACCQTAAGPPFSLAACEPAYRRIAGLSIPCGHIAPELANTFAAYIQSTDAIIRIENHHRIAVYSCGHEKEYASLESIPILRPLLNGPDIAACPGTTYCKHALVNTHAVEMALRETLNDTADCPAIRISGCPNGCAHSTVADIGLSGRIKKNDKGEKVEGFQVYSGGHMGCRPGLAEPVNAFVPSSGIPETVKGLIAESP